VLLGKWSEVTSLKKENVALFFPTAISFTTKNNEKFMFASFLSRNYAFKYFCKLWHLQCPFYDAEMSENGEVSSYDSNRMLKNDEDDNDNDDKNDEPNRNYAISTEATAAAALSSERFKYNKAYDISSSNSSDSSGSHSDSLTSKSKTSISSNNKNDDDDGDGEDASNVERKNLMKIENLEGAHVNSLTLKKKPASIIPANNQLSQKNALIGRNSSDTLDKQQLLACVGDGSPDCASASSLNKVFVLFCSKNFLVNFLVFLILFVILVTLYIYVFIIFFHVNQIEKKLSDLHERLTE
jgi:hypothetical protein